MSQHGDPTHLGSMQQVSFVSDAFPRSEEDDTQVNPGRWGFKAADFMRQELESRGWQASEPIGEDWGWAVSANREKATYLVGCGIVDGEDNMFLVIIDARRPVLGLFGRKPDVAQLAAAVNEILRANPDIRDVVWEP